MASAGTGERQDARPPVVLRIAEEVVTRLNDPNEVFGVVADEGDLEAATEYRIHLAMGAIAEALVESSRSLSYLRVLSTALEQRGYRRGYLDGALAAGAVCQGLAKD